MTVYALLASDAREILESSRKDYMEKRLALIERTKKEIAVASLIWVAREVVFTYPQVRYVNLEIHPGLLPGSAALDVTEVFDAERNLLSDAFNRELCRNVQNIFFETKNEYYESLPTGEYDFVELAGRQI